MSAVQDSSPLSETRLQEIEKKYSGLSWGPFASPWPTIADLLAEVRRLQSALAAASEETAQAVKDAREECAGVVESWRALALKMNDNITADALRHASKQILARTRSLTPGADDGQ